MKYKYSVFISRFSPFHRGHKQLIDYAFTFSDKVIVVIGSSNTARTIRNFLTENEREDMIKNSFAPQEQERLIFIHMKDYLYIDNLWLLTLQQKISEITDYCDDDIALVSFKDDKAEYLKAFPQFSHIQYDFNDYHSSDDIRHRFFTYDLSFGTFVPEYVKEYLLKFQKTPEFTALKEEYDYIRDYRRSWDNSPFKPSFNCTDAIVLKSSHVLLIRRGRQPGKGLLALPGGFVNEDETLVEAAIRELKEETKINLNFTELKKSITDQKVMDNPYRSARGRVFSHSFLFNLGFGPLPKIKAADDAAGAQWISISDAIQKEREFFEDHFHILNYFLFKQ